MNTRVFREPPYSDSSSGDSNCSETSKSNRSDREWVPIGESLLAPPATETAAYDALSVAPSTSGSSFTCCSRSDAATAASDKDGLVNEMEIHEYLVNTSAGPGTDAFRKGFLTAVRDILRLDQYWTDSVLAKLAHPRRVKPVMCRMSWRPADQDNKIEVQAESGEASPCTVDAKTKNALQWLRESESIFGHLVQAGGPAIVITFNKYFLGSHGANGQEEEGIHMNLYPPGMDEASFNIKLGQGGAFYYE